MTVTGIENLDRAIQKTNIWLKELMGELDWEDRDRAFHAWKVTLHTLRDRLTPEEAVDLSAQLPRLIRAFYFDGWKPHSTPLKERHKDQFLAHLEEGIRCDHQAEAEQIARAVFRILARRVSPGELDDIRQMLPKEIRALFPEEPEAAEVAGAR
jgi:uncharacterized protein (DUF2267 family)